MRYYLSLGANLGEREIGLRKAVEMMEQRIGKVLRCSSFFYSTPWGFESEHNFCNVCCLVETPLAPLEMLQQTQAIERALGRTEKSENGHYADRAIDIDLIRAFDDDGKEVFVETSLLTLPHPLWQEREFVKVPLAEIMQ